MLHGIEVTKEPEDPKWNVVNNHKKQPVSSQGTQVLSSTVSDCSSDVPGEGGPCLKETGWIFSCCVLTTEDLHHG
jgi:hypothetical protein